MCASYTRFWLSTINSSLLILHWQADVVQGLVSWVFDRVVEFDVRRHVSVVDCRQTVIFSYLLTSTSLVSARYTLTDEYQLSVSTLYTAWYNEELKHMTMTMMMMTCLCDSWFQKVCILCFDGMLFMYSLDSLLCMNCDQLCLCITCIKQFVWQCLYRFHDPCIMSILT